jgi:hypothetical protein
MPAVQHSSVYPEVPNDYVVYPVYQEQRQEQFPPKEASAPVQFTAPVYEEYAVEKQTPTATQRCSCLTRKFSNLLISSISTWAYNINNCNIIVWLLSCSRGLNRASCTLVASS